MLSRGAAQSTEVLFEVGDKNKGLSFNYEVDQIFFVVLLSADNGTIPLGTTEPDKSPIKRGKLIIA